MANHETITRYPLHWPATWPRHEFRHRANFGTKQAGEFKRALTVSNATERLAREAHRLHARDEVLSTNLRLRLDGGPRSDQSAPSDPGVAFYFTLKGKPRVLACDRWHTVADNIAAIAAHIAAIRAVDRYGVGSLDQAFAGYTALPPTGRDWSIVLNVPPTATADEIERAFRDLARRAHPDVGGSDHDMARLNHARDEALRDVGAR